ncbi:MAG: hypothetical protein JKY68_06660 [Rhodospirillales bacterium]|nr:hypothetical protein [Rhodospirillales bacterium]
MESYSNISGKLSGLSKEGAKLLADAVNALFTKSAKDSSFRTPCRYTSLSRYVLHTALLLADEKRKLNSTIRRPAFKEISKGYGEFVGKAEGVLNEILTPEINKDHFTSAGYMSSVGNGPRTPKINFSIALYLCYLGEMGVLDAVPFQRDISKEDEGFLLKFENFVSLWATNISGSDLKGSEKNKRKLIDDCQPEFKDKRSMHPQVSIHFAYEKEKFESFKTFQKRFSSPHDERAHFLVYRPQKSNPSFLSKTFLAISGPIPSEVSPGEVSFKFVHIYAQSSDTGGARRISMGRAVPLKDAFYLVGGQIIDLEDRIHRPFNAIKIVYFPWALIDSGADFLFGMTMSTSTDRTPIASRLVARATPIYDSRLDFKLGSVSSDTLAQDLKRDIELEQSILGNNPSYGENEKSFASVSSLNSIDSQVERILTHSKNSPGNRQLLGKWDAVNCDPEQKVEYLTGSNFPGVLEGKFGSTSFPKFQNDKGETFEFWKSLHFSPLTAED